MNIFYILFPLEPTLTGGLLFLCFEVFFITRKYVII
nr:MAG TPA: hypothetical protein [Caudoviricetes sp.]